MRFKLGLLVAGVVAFVGLIEVQVLSATCPAAPNGTFDTDASHWSNNSTFAPGLGNPPGSDQVGPVTANTLVTCSDALSDCLPIAPGDQCILTADGYFALGQPTDGAAYLEYIYYSDNNCASPITSSPAATLAGSTQNAWTAMNTGILTTPVGSQSVRIAYNVCAQPETSVTSYFDNIASSPAPVVQIPALSPLTTFLLLLALALAAIVALRRKNHA